MAESFPLESADGIGIARITSTDLGYVARKCCKEGALTMSISFEPFASHGHFPTYDPVHAEAARPVMVFQLQCRSCGFEPEDNVVAPRLCPKCHSNSWERFPRPGSILDNSARY